MMEFNEKLQNLRKQKGLTQEELAAALYVSRTAVSKWESGRGCPSVDSLKALAKFFSISIDDLLSGEEALTLAHTNIQQTKKRCLDLVLGLLDCSTALLFFLPLFRHSVNGTIHAAGLLNLTAAQPYTRIAYIFAVSCLIIFGLLLLTLQHCSLPFWIKQKHRISFMLSTAGTLLFILSPQPYAASILFTFLIIKALLLLNHR